jgi:heme/copper-type cytochrome/quinol oxidase subunit 2
MTMMIVIMMRVMMMIIMMIMMVMMIVMMIMTMMIVRCDESDHDVRYDDGDDYQSVQ